MVGDKIQYEFIAALPSPPPQLSVTDYPFTPGGVLPKILGGGVPQVLKTLTLF